MARRQTAVLRNLDDPLRVLGFISLRSCGLVLFFFAAAHSMEALFGLISLVFGTWAFLVELGAAGALAVVLSLAERADDEHFVPSAIRYFLSRPWAVLHSGATAHHHRRPEIQRVFDAARSH
jgi:hypothetical protein